MCIAFGQGSGDPVCSCCVIWIIWRFNSQYISSLALCWYKWLVMALYLTILLVNCGWEDLTIWLSKMHTITFSDVQHVIQVWLMWKVLGIMAGVVEWVERLFPVLIDHGIRTHRFEPWSSQTNNLKSMLVTSWPRAPLYYDRSRTDWLSVRIIGLSGISGHGAGGMVS